MRFGETQQTADYRESGGEGEERATDAASHSMYSRSMYHGEHGVVVFVGEGVGGERENRLRALHTTRPPTVGYVGGCDQEEGVIKCPYRESGAEGEEVAGD